MKTLWILALTLIWTGPSLFAQPEPAPRPNPRAEELSDGYALLDNLADKEKQAHAIFIFKDATDSTKETTEILSKLFGRIDRELEVWDHQDPSINLKINHMPKIETVTREQIEKEHRHDLFALKSPAFDRYFMILQYESVSYALALVHELHRLEPSEVRRKTLLGWEHELRQLESRVVEEMMSSSSITESTPTANQTANRR